MEPIFDSLDTCLQQECQKFNVLIKHINETIQTIKKVIKGEIQMNEEVEAIFDSFFNNQVPASWKKISYPSNLPLSSWIDMLKRKADFFRGWVNEKPVAFWLSAFFYPQGFLTALLQNYARRKRMAIDQITFQYNFKNFYDKEHIHNKMEDGCFVFGLYMESCRYNTNTECIEDSFAGVRYSQAPIIQFQPTNNVATSTYEHYSLPVYKTINRESDQIRSSNQSNYILSISCPTKEKPEFWALRGAAFICEIDQ